MMRVFRTRTFTRWMRKAGVSDTGLCEAVSEMEYGLIDADLGGQVVKKRVALQGRGKRAGARTIVATNRGNRWFFLFGFNKNERANLDDRELKAFQELASQYLPLKDPEIDLAVSTGKFTEICHDNEEA
jgi:hypothetical protein